MIVEWGQTWPTLEEFCERGASSRVVPVVRRLLGDEASAVGIYRRVARGEAGTFLLESAEHDGTWNRWSFVGAHSAACLFARDGQAWWEGEVPAGIPTSGGLFDVIRATLDILATPAIDGLPPLTSGLIGALGWDTVAQWEPQLAATAPREVDTPDVALALASDVIAVDHVDGSVWLIANAINGNGLAEGIEDAYADAVARLDAMEERLGAPMALDVSPGASSGPLPPINQRVSREDFCAVVEACKEHVRAGDVFQVVPSQRLDVACAASALDVYRALRTINPSPYMYLLAMREGEHDFAVVGASPETLMRVRGGELTTFPIAGSRPRSGHPDVDRARARDLLADEKERSEHLMLVDLARNDLSKVCEPESVSVSGFMEILSFSHIMHITSTVSGRVRPDVDAIDCLAATFPAGTLSGAPKPKAIELINRYEPARRGLYGGVVGHITFSGEADLAIAIRTAVLADSRAWVQAGAGIVADSDPRTEYEETMTKASASLRAAQVAHSWRVDADEASA
ncbi:chorismate-binding protein [Nanchangia anserum]|uniref:Anthranilate synthase component 1 n=1 Tax=Nanchangia anserum TaxID=2692125 RepID=A0A8I0GAY5_9ACTO|nr:chorismate-binding protein [Nanchangia anserum]QOX82595.1 chorismate-binding protein [Nanchangia anserum]